ncbi:MAG TPA: TonB-dependent receptor [Terriglobia bacterium]|nr:TonB-dependent receptor [Terriglobia bacterium]
MLTKLRLTSCHTFLCGRALKRFAAIQILLPLAALAFLAVPLQAQLYSGSVTGVISDPSGAVIPGAKVELTDITKGYNFNVTSDATGRYILRNIPPSNYKLTVEATGFKTSTRTDIVLDVNQNATVNFSLELGTTTQTVEVTGAPPLMSTQDATTGQEVNRTYINDLPLVGRGVFDLAFLAPGVNPAAGRAFGDSGGVANNFVSNGGRNATSDILLDGVSTTDYEQNGGIIVPLYTPSVDAVQEFKVQQNNFSAEIGFSGNTVLNVVMRSGTNQLHGSLYEFLRNQVLDANNWFNNQAGVDLPARRYNQFGGTVGGPIIIPHLYNGKDKTFFFFDYQATRDHSASSFNGGVPSALERQGNFGELCTAGWDPNGMCNDSSQQLWDPYSGFNDPSNGWTNQAIIPYNNMATYQSPGSPTLAGTPYQVPTGPGNLIDPVSMKMMSFFPLPNVGVGTGSYDPYNNWHGAGVNINNGDQMDIKIDHRFGASNLLSSRYSEQWGNGHGATCFDNPLDPCNGGPVISSAHAFVLNDTWTVNPSTVVNVSYGFTRSFSNGVGPSGDFPNFSPVTDLGLPSYITNSGFPTSPDVYIYDGYQQTGCCGSLGYQAWAIIKYAQETHDLLGSLDKISGRHEIKFGGEFRMHRINFGQPGAPAGIMTFGSDTTAQNPGLYSGGGDSMASFLTGISGPNQWGEYEVPLFVATQSNQFGSFIQDNWRVTDKLTVNLGMRYDLDLPRTERHNRMEWFDPHAALPFSVPGMNPNPTGAEVFTGVNGNSRTIANNYYKEYAPRVGLAYRFWKNTVFRAGYGIYYNPSVWAAAGTGPVAGFDGFTGYTNWPQTYQSDGFTPETFMKNPFPFGVNPPTNASLGPLTQIGQTASGNLRSDNAGSYTQTWSAGFEHELPGAVLLDLNYVGTKGTHLYFNGAGNINYLGPSVEKMAPNAIGNLANNYVANPFYGLITDPTSSLSGTEVPEYQLLRPYPQFTGVFAAFPPRGNSSYHAFQLRLQKNMSHGLQFVGNYTWSKTLSDSDVSGYTEWLGGFDGIQDPNNLKLEKSVSEYSMPQVLTFGYVYSLPFGRGQHFGSKLNPVVDAVLGGWKTAGLWRFDSGQPVSINFAASTAIPTYGTQRPNLLAPLQRNTGADWRTQYFANPQAIKTPDNYTIGTAPRTIPNVYMPGARTAGLSLMKEFPLSSIHEGMRAEFRAETFNVFNHPQFGCLNGAVQGGFLGSDSTTYSGFGELNCQANQPRELQLGLKLYF